MTFRTLNPAILAALFAASAAQAAQVHIEGAADAAGAYELTAGARLADGMLLARPRVDAYLLGASFERPQAVQAQTRLRAGLQYGAEQLAESADAQVAALAHTLLTWLDTHQATGRAPIAGAARLIQVQPANNPVLAPGDTLRFPLQPRTITVMGAVEQTCRLPHSPQRDARDYLRDCRPSVFADRDNIYVIQPDGHVQQLGIAFWNRADLQAVAAGGTVFVPVRASLIKRIDPLFNSDFAAFIATQPVSP
ncbi:MULTISPECIES: capsule biosynthesis GfcC family protein [Stenotrophomonas]|uniref:Capsule biosynthesis GfcC family protein n=1 Tax=Stenotrophomonas lactitubi TaxID=2045214 RepID=A0AAW4GG42_9GAMM|nr:MULTISPECIES: capsule biosynthesis GfcC family protein [Stenotrophomonas]MBM9913263.1 capsule biosynthesis GfcC family protein [Stenotrophomonas lactitubi]MBM9923149.1 capsule biosynthesis GfcC family protein [Stenotrophomonas lactitubi]MBM9939140.1 capsule biosynthesis GfcC family protein [Stenotrophomonas lactitubi]